MGFMIYLAASNYAIVYRKLSCTASESNQNHVCTSEKRSQYVFKIYISALTLGTIFEGFQTLGEILCVLKAAYSPLLAWRQLVH